MYRMVTRIPCRKCGGDGEGPYQLDCSGCDGNGNVVVSNRIYPTIDDAAVAVAQFVLDAIPPSRNPIDTTVAHRVLTWDGEGELVFPLANLTRVTLTKSP